MRVGILVNPDAGLGGKLGLKGSDGKATEAREAGAEDRAGPRMKNCLSYLPESVTAKLNFIAAPGRMGGDWIPFEFASSGDKIESSTAQDTMNWVKQHTDLDLLVYAGGDGTTRDIVQALDGQDLPIIGVPAGVKMHSGCFATTPKAAAEVIMAYASGDLLLSRTEVMDLDEETYRQGEWKVKLYAQAFTPAAPRFIQGSKEQIERESEEETIEGMAEHIHEMIQDEPNLLLILGSGGTIKAIGEEISLELSLLGIDILQGNKLHKDLNEQQILDLLKRHEGPVTLLLSPMGGQGFLLGRGNLQLSPDVIRAVKLENILGIATPSKLLTLNQLRIDTGDESLDAIIRKRKFVKILQGYRTTRVMRVADE